jgi:hypothetical protein
VLEVRIERGSKRTFATAVDWPGLSRSGRDEASALEALVAAAPRYASAVARKRIRFTAPKDVGSLKVVGRSTGNATTDFGAPAAEFLEDRDALRPAGLKALTRILEACWAEFDAAAASAKVRTLSKGPRGGGRELDEIVSHVIEADQGYIGALGWKHDRARTASVSDPLAATRRAILEGIAASARGEIPARGPRGGVRWKPRYLVRRSAWHWLDHAWEIEDRSS